MKRVGRINNKIVVQGDPNTITKNQILLVNDNQTNQIKSIKKRDNNGSLKSITDDDYLYFKVKDWNAIVVEGISIKDLLMTDDGIFLQPLVSSCLVNFFLIGQFYAPTDIFMYTNGEGNKRFLNVKAIRIFKGYLPDDNEFTKMVKLQSLKDIERVMSLLGMENANLSNALEPITKDEFDSMEIPTLSL